MTKKKKAESKAEADLTITREVIERFNAPTHNKSSKLGPIFTAVAEGRIWDQNTGEGLKAIDCNVGAAHRVAKELKLTDKLKIRSMIKGKSRPIIVGRIA